MKVEVVLGLDCLMVNKGVISLSDKSLILGGEIYVLEFEGRIGCFRIVVLDIIFLLLRFEIIVIGKVIVLDGDWMDFDVGIVELFEIFLNLDRGMVGCILVKGG